MRDLETGVRLGLALAELRNAADAIEADRAKPRPADAPDWRLHNDGLLYAYRRSIAEIEHALNIEPSEVTA